MALLHNRISQKELKEQLNQESEKRITLSFYRYFHIHHPQQYRDDLYTALQVLRVFGRVYIASEGINAQISVLQTSFQAFKDQLYGFEGLDGVRLNIAVDDDGKSFWVLKIKVRDKIVADGIDDPDFDVANKGKYVNADAFNDLAENPDTVIVDMRNHYEYEVGHFEHAIEIPSDTFREQLPMAVKLLEDKKDKNIIMYCTGGIRCEKASAFMLHHGFSNVYHLDGGIINYTNEVREAGKPNKFLGKNFVFDDRLGERISDKVIAICHQCGKPSDTHTNCRNEACHLLFIQCSNCSSTFNGCCSEACQNAFKLPEEEQKKLRQGKQNGTMVFNKSRQRLRPGNRADVPK